MDDASGSPGRAPRAAMCLPRTLRSIWSAVTQRRTGGNIGGCGGAASEYPTRQSRRRARCVKHGPELRWVGQRRHGAQQDVLRQAWSAQLSHTDAHVIRHAYVREREDTEQSIHADSAGEETLRYTSQQSVKPRIFPASFAAERR